MAMAWRKLHIGARLLGKTTALQGDMGAGLLEIQPSWIQVGAGALEVEWSETECCTPYPVI